MYKDALIVTVASHGESRWMAIARNRTDFARRATTTVAAMPAVNQIARQIRDRIERSILLQRNFILGCYDAGAFTPDGQLS